MTLIRLSILWLVLATLPTWAQTSPADPLAPTRDTKSAAEIDHEWQVSIAKYDSNRAEVLKEMDS